LVQAWPFFKLVYAVVPGIGQQQAEEKGLSQEAEASEL
jgi:hypothetical protein